MFNTGDSVIVIADSKKGKTFLPDGEHEGGVFELNRDEVYVSSPDCKSVWIFLNDGSCRGYAGMSIRHKEKWILGQIPSDYRGEAWITDGVKIGKRYRQSNNMCSILDNEGIQDYTHYMLKSPELTPTLPPIEVEAYGMLEAMNKLRDAGSWQKALDDGTIAKIVYFFSLLATAENLEEYLGVAKGEPQWVSYPSMTRSSMTLDQFINWYKNSYDEDGLTFTAAALKELRIK